MARLIYILIYCIMVDDSTYLTEANDMQISAPLLDRKARATVIDFTVLPEYKWPLPVPFKFSEIFTDVEKDHIRNSLDKLSNMTCVRFEEHDVSEDLGGVQHVLYHGDSLGVCKSYVGMQNVQDVVPPQGINLGEGCVVLRIPAHETMHMLGFYHEHTQPGRDEYVTIDWNNIIWGKERNYEEKHESNTTHFDLHYDFGSVMHYSGFSNTINPTVPNIQPNDYDHRMNHMGQREEITFYDALTINKAYCSDVCEELPCENGGYTDPNDCSKCQCLTHYTGSLCTEMAAGNLACDPKSGHYNLTKEKPQICILSPNFNDGSGEYTRGDECFWKFDAPAGCKIQFWSDNIQGYLPKSNGFCQDWLEVFYKDNHKINGRRFCDNDFEDQTKMASDSNSVLALFRSFEDLPNSEPEEELIGFHMCFSIADEKCFDATTTTTTTTTVSTTTTIDPTTSVSTTSEDETTVKTTTSSTSTKTTFNLPTFKKTTVTSTAKPSTTTPAPTTTAITTMTTPETTTIIIESTEAKTTKVPTTKKVTASEDDGGFPWVAVVIPLILIILVLSACILFFIWKMKKDDKQEKPIKKLVKSKPHAKKVTPHV